MDLTRINQVRRLLPRSDLILGYGSGVFLQRGYSYPGSEMIDLLVFAQDRRIYIRELLAKRYITSSARMFSGICNPQAVFFPGVRFVNGLTVKIGVVQTQQGLERLSDWGDSFYIPGRLQKPVAILDTRDDSIHARFSSVQRLNRLAALRAAVINLPRDTAYTGFKLEELFESLASLSYIGDIRVGLAENPLKIRNIVAAQRELLEAIYLSEFGAVGITAQPNGEYVSSRRPEELWNSLPEGFRRSAVQLVEPRSALRATLANINRRESIQQALVGLGTAGVLNSLNYLARKVSKRFS